MLSLVVKESSISEEQLNVTAEKMADDNAILKNVIKNIDNIIVFQDSELID